MSGLRWNALVRVTAVLPDEAEDIVADLYRLAPPGLSESQRIAYVAGMRLVLAALSPDKLRELAAVGEAPPPQAADLPALAKDLRCALNLHIKEGSAGPLGSYLYIDEAVGDRLLLAALTRARGQKVRRDD